MLPLPISLDDPLLRRYGFHGLSYESIMTQLQEIDPRAAAGRIVIAHLGAGASMVAIAAGQSRDTTMGFSPTGGLMMGTRPGDLDPGVLLYLLQVAELRIRRRSIACSIRSRACLVCREPAGHARTARA